MLLRAFGPPGAPPPGAVDPAAALAVARRFEMSARIAARQGRARLSDELGAEAAAGFARDRAAAAAVGVHLERLAEEVATVAGAIGAPIVFLKFMALQLSGILGAGSRTACDLDVLTSPERAADLAAALEARGFRSAGSMEEHQLPALVHRAGGAVEIHLHVPGVRPGPGRASATLADLARLGLLRPVPRLPGECSVPGPELGVAHGLVHALAQHGGAPGAYSLLRAFGDLIDLGFAAAEGEALAVRWMPWVARDLAPEEVAAARALCRALARGEVTWEEIGEESGAGLLLRHALAGRLDPGYARALKLSLFAPQPSELPAPARLARSAWRALVLSRAQVDAIYGRPAGPLGYLGRRLWRPFDLAGRLALSLASRAAGASSLCRGGVRRLGASRR